MKFFHKKIWILIFYVIKMGYSLKNIKNDSSLTTPRFTALASNLLMMKTMLWSALCLVVGLRLAGSPIIPKAGSYLTQGKTQSRLNQTSSYATTLMFLIFEGSLISSGLLLRHHIVLNIQQLWVHIRTNWAMSIQKPTITSQNFLQIYIISPTLELSIWLPDTLMFVNTGF